MQVQLFIPCFLDQLFPQTALNVVRVLERLGCQVSYNPDQTCCGQPAFNAGRWDDSRAVAEKFIKAFDATTDYIVAPGGSCVGFIRNYYEWLFKDTDISFEAGTAAKFYELTEFITSVLQVDDVGARFEGVATYHDACGALRECGIKHAPRRLLSRVEGLKLVEADDASVCCGFGGTFAVKFESVSAAMAEQKVLHAYEIGAEYIISTDLSCLLNLDGYIRNAKLPIKPMHIADVLASGW